jgi:hypothetical protein
MPFKSEAQRRYMYAAAARGEIKKSVVADFQAHTPRGADLPYHVKKKTGAASKHLKK